MSSPAYNISSPVGFASGYSALLPSAVPVANPLAAYGPVPDTVFDPLAKVPEGARYCPMVNGYVPSDLPYRVRGLRNLKPKKTIGTLLGKKPELIMARGLTHSKIRLVSLEEAQQTESIRCHDLGEGLEIQCDEVQAEEEALFQRKLLPLWEAQSRHDVKYGGANPCLIDLLASRADRVKLMDYIGRVHEPGRAIAKRTGKIETLVPLEFKKDPLHATPADDEDAAPLAGSKSTACVQWFNRLHRLT